MAVSPFFP